MLYGKHTSKFFYQQMVAYIFVWFWHLMSSFLTFVYMRSIDMAVCGAIFRWRPVCSLLLVFSCLCTYQLQPLLLEGELCGFCRTVLCISTAYAVMRYLSVCLSITCMYSVETNKCTFKIFSPSCKHTILIFPHQTLWQYSNVADPPPLNGGVESRWGRQKSLFSTNIWLVDRWLVECDQQLMVVRAVV